MECASWLIKKRSSVEERYDRLWAPIYDDHWGAQIDPLHAQMVTRVVDAYPSDGLILDTACGTGKYWSILLASGKSFCAFDQSHGMLDRASAKYPQVNASKLDLQEMEYESTFDLTLCMDAMEMVFPEDWPIVLANFHRALKYRGQLYFTVEVNDPEAVQLDYAAGKCLGPLVVPGEAVFANDTREEEAGYHYYPAMDQVRDWLIATGFSIMEEVEGDDYHHFWVVKNG